MPKPTKTQLQKSLKDALDQIKTLRSDLANAGSTNVSLRSEIQKLRSAPPKEKVVEPVVGKGREDSAVEIARLRAAVNKLEREANAK